MENSNLPLRTWMYALFFITHTKKSYSACEMQRILGHSRYETIWYLMQRIRQFMSDNNRKLFCSGVFDHRENLNNAVAVRASRKDLMPNLKTTVFINPESYLSSHFRGISDQMLLVVETEPSDFNIPSSLRYVSITEHNQVQYNFKPAKIQPQKKSLPKWVQNVVNNLDCVIRGIHHLVKRKYLQLYLDEFSFKYNSRNEPDVFQMLLDKVFSPFRYNSE